MSFRPQNREVLPGADKRNSIAGSVRRVYGDNRFIAPVFNRIPSAPANRFSQVITNNNVLNCVDPNWPRQMSVGSQSREVGFHADVRQQAQRNDYQKGVNTWGYAPGTPLIVSNHSC